MTAALPAVVGTIRGASVELLVQMPEGGEVSRWLEAERVPEALRPYGTPIWLRLADGEIRLSPRPCLPNSNPQLAALLAWCQDHDAAAP